MPVENVSVLEFTSTSNLGSSGFVSETNAFTMREDPKALIDLRFTILLLARGLEESAPDLASSSEGAILNDVPNFYCIGLNYTKHAIETGMDIPKEHILFSKATSALSGPFDNVIIPKNSKDRKTKKK